jgi:signal transduction histidine kinase
MQQNKLFNLTRLRLAGWYAGVMGVILSLCGFAVYEAMAQDHWHASERELKSIAGTLHDGLEPVLKQPERIEPSVQQLLPGLCIVTTNCSQSTTIRRVHVLGITQQNNYYVRFLNLSKRSIGTVGEPPEGLILDPETTTRPVLQDQKGTRYQQLSLLLKTSNGEPWGYMQIVRSLKEYDEHLAALGVFLLLGLPIAMLLIGGASWWLAGLAMQPVYQSYQQIQQFTADAAHELRTPLAAIQATVEMTLDTNDLTLDEARSTLQTIERQNNRLSQLIQDLLLLSRMDLQVLSLKFRSCCLNDLVVDLIEELAALALAANVSLQADIQVNQPLYVLGDEEQLYRLITNLIINAIQYTPQGGNVTVTLNHEDQHALIQVQDTGIGIASKDQVRVFDRFYRVNSDRSRHTGGAGLGLAIAKAIAETHNGSLHVQSGLGKGSTFTIRLPLKLNVSC